MDTNEMIQEVMNTIDEMVSKTELLVTQILISIEGYSASRIPVNTGNMIDSQYREVEVGTTSINGRIWNGAEYAKWVHRMPGTLKGQPRAHFGKTAAGVEFGGGTEVGNYWDPTGEPRWMEKGIDEMVNQDLETLIQINLRV